MSHTSAADEIPRAADARYKQVFAPLDAEEKDTHLSPDFNSRALSGNSDSTLYDAGAFASSNDAAGTTPSKRPQSVRRVSDASVSDASSRLLAEKEKPVESASTSPSQRHRPWFIFRDWWLAEIGAALLSLGCMVAVAAILFKIEKTPLDDWAFPIAPNSLLSVLLTVAKTTLLLSVANSMTQLKWNHFSKRPRPLRDFQVFDDASKGPWGAVQLLWHTRGSAVLASVGAFIIVFSLAMDPFAQQILAFPSRLVAASGNATVPYANHYGAMNNNTPTDIGYAVQRAVYGGLFSDKITPPGSCKTGNCTFEPFSSLGVCQSCQDISAQTSLTCVTNNITANVSAYMCSYNSPSGSVFNGCSLQYPGVAPESCFTYKQTHGHTKFISIANINPNLTTLVDFIAIRIHNRSDIEPGAKFEPGTITECSIQWCGKHYPSWNLTNSEVTNNTVIVSPLEPSPPNNTTPDIRVGHIATASYISTEPLNRNQTVKLSFGIGGREQTNLKAFLANLFTTSLASANATATPEINPAEQITMASALYNANQGDMQQTVAALASALDARVRQASGQIFDGIAWKSETYIEVKWAWLVLPSFLVLLGILFLFTSLVRTWMAKSAHVAPQWKSSTIAPLFHGLEGFDENEMSTQGLQSRVSMEDAARRMRVQLRPGAGGMRFVRSDRAERELMG